MVRAAHGAGNVVGNLLLIRAHYPEITKCPYGSTMRKQVRNPILKCAKGLNRHFSKENTQVASKPYEITINAVHH